MAERFDFVCAGHICLDITPALPDTGSTDVARVFRPGTLIQTGPVTISCGGTVHNTGVPLAILGNRVALMGKRGADEFGQAVEDILLRRGRGAQPTMRITTDANTSYTIVLSPPGVDRVFLHHPGANDTFGAEDIDMATVAAARMMHFGYPPLMARTYADGGAELEAILRGARQAGATTSLDLAYPSGPSAGPDWRAILSRTLRWVDLFTPSVEELMIMLQPDLFRRLSADGSEDILPKVTGSMLGDLAETCLSFGAAAVVIKCGERGIYLRSAGVDRLSAAGAGKPTAPEEWADRELFAPSYRVDRVVTATGAGDCAIAGLLTAWLRGLGPVDALRIACACGAQNLAAADSTSGVREWDETLAWIADRPPRSPAGAGLDPLVYDEQEQHYVGPADASR